MFAAPRAVLVAVWASAMWANAKLMPRLDFSAGDASEHQAALLSHMRSNTPFVLTGLEDVKLDPAPVDSWFTQQAGHTVVHIPPKHKQTYKTQWRWPAMLKQILQFVPDAAWGGQPGFFEDAEGSLISWLSNLLS